MKLGLEHTLLILSGFSGVGKGTVCEKLKGQFVNGKPIEIIRSVTDRTPRFAGENYTFVTKQQFHDYVSKDLLLEYNDDYSSCGYGTPMWEVEKAFSEGKVALLEIDYVGLEKILTQGKVLPSCVRSVFLAAPAKEVASRLINRGTETGEKIRSRLSRSIEEANHLACYDAIVVNHSVDETVTNVLRVFSGEMIVSNFDVELYQQEMQKILRNGL